MRLNRGIRGMGSTMPLGWDTLPLQEVPVVTAPPETSALPIILGLSVLGFIGYKVLKAPKRRRRARA